MGLFEVIRSWIIGPREMSVRSEITEIKPQITELSIPMKEPTVSQAIETSPQIKVEEITQTPSIQEVAPQIKVEEITQTSSIGEKLVNTLEASAKSDEPIAGIPKPRKRRTTSKRKVKEVSQVSP